MLTTEDYGDGRQRRACGHVYRPALPGSPEDYCPTCEEAEEAEAGREERSRAHAYLDQITDGGGASGRFSAACALYWHCYDWHEGQWSDRYSILSTLGYRPGASEQGPEVGSIDELIYDDLGSGALDPRDVLAWIESQYGEEE